MVVTEMAKAAKAVRPGEVMIRTTTQVRMRGRGAARWHDSINCRVVIE